MGFSVLVFDKLPNCYDVIHSGIATLKEALECVSSSNSKAYTFCCRDELVKYAKDAAERESSDNLLIRTEYFDVSKLSREQLKSLVIALKTSGKEYILNESEMQNLLTIKCSACQSKKHYSKIITLDHNIFICRDCYSIKFSRCDSCHQTFLSDKIIQTKNNNYCLECFLDYFYCDKCKKIMKPGEEHYYENEEKYICDNCLKEDGQKCICCGEIFLKSDMRESAEGYICSSCCNDEICDKCHAPLEEGNFYSDNMWGGFICENCYHERYVKCPSCGEYAPRDSFEENDEFKGDAVCRECDEKLYKIKAVLIDSNKKIETKIKLPGNHKHLWDEVYKIFNTESLQVIPIQKGIGLIMLSFYNESESSSNMFIIETDHIKLNVSGKGILIGGHGENFWSLDLEKYSSILSTIKYSINGSKAAQ